MEQDITTITISQRNTLPVRPGAALVAAAALATPLVAGVPLAAPEPGRGQRERLGAEGGRGGAEERGGERSVRAVEIQTPLLPPAPGVRG